MENTNIELLQYEIRCIPLLNFSNEIRSALPRYLTLFDKFNIGDDGNSKEQMVLTSVSDNFQITIRRDIIILRADGELISLNDSRSVVMDTFFKIYALYESLPSFVKPVSTLYYSLSIRQGDDESLIQESKAFGSVNFVSALGFEPTKVGFGIESKEENHFRSLSYETYNGIEDITDSKNLSILDQSYLTNLLSIKGHMIEIRDLTRLVEPKLTFKTFKNNNANVIDVIKKFWHEK